MSKKDYSKEAVQERPEDTSSEILPDEGSAMGKEIKIGLGVILVLLVVFGAVLYYRLSGPPSDTTMAQSDQPAKTKTATEKNSLLAKPAAPAVVTATAGSSSRERPSVADMAGWSGTGGQGSARATQTDNQIPSAPATYMPTATAAINPPSADPFQRPTAASTNASYPDATAPSSGGLAGLESDDPGSPIGSAQAGSGEAFAAQPNPLRSATDMTAPAPNRRGVPDNAGYRCAASSSSQQAVDVSTTVQTTTVRQPPAGIDTARPTFRSVPEPMNTYAAPAASGEPGSAYAAPQTPVNSGKYVIQPNDSYWTISEQLYGTGAYFQALAEHNRKKVPDENRLRAGDEILTPDLADLEKSYPSLCPKPERRESAPRHLSMVSTPARLGGRTYVVQEGDTLFDIARFELGKASRWAEIYEMNRDLLGSDFDHLTPGMQLALPHDQPAGKVTQRPDEVYQR